MEQEEFTRIERAININEEATKKQLAHPKFKTFNTLKYKPQKPWADHLTKRQMSF